MMRHLFDCCVGGVTRVVVMLPLVLLGFLILLGGWWCKPGRRLFFGLERLMSRVDLWLSHTFREMER